MKVVLSYRRADTPGVAGRIYDRLVQHYGDESVFMDIASIPFGVDFREHIRKELDQCDVLLAIIGPRWLGGGECQRIQDETDLVRIEVETALQRGIPVVPILIDGTPMPRTEQLPATLRDLASRNAAPVDSGRDFHPHVISLIRSLDRLFARGDLAGEEGSAEIELQPRDCSSEATTRSLHTDNKTVIGFTNKSQERLGIYWLDYFGERVSYGVLEPGGTATFNTFLNHPWVIACADGRCIALYQPSSRPCRATITEEIIQRKLGR